MTKFSYVLKEIVFEDIFNDKKANIFRIPIDIRIQNIYLENNTKSVAEN